jgi:hypothetical protein
MHRVMHKVTEMVLPTLLIAVVTGIWACLWLPPH